jgi:hypothetical protein
MPNNIVFAATVVVVVVAAVATVPTYKVCSASSIFVIRESSVVF